MPPPPTNVTYTDLTEARVQIHWDPPELHEAFSIKTYHIAHRKNGSGEHKWQNDTISADQLTTFQIDNLESDILYTVKIFAENEYGFGKESSKLGFTTMKAKGRKGTFVI